jgi:hypothetical protein
MTFGGQGITFGSLSYKMSLHHLVTNNFNGDGMFLVGCEETKNSLREDMLAEGYSWMRVV